MSEFVRENCGVGVTWDTNDAIKASRDGLDNRGKNAEGYGTTSNGGITAVRSYFGLLDEQAVRTLLGYEPGKPVQVHTRYATRGARSPKEVLRAAHPHTVGGHSIDQGNHYLTVDAKAAMVHNGTVKYDFSPYGFETKTDCDTEQLLYAHHTFGPEWVLRNVPASYSVITMCAGADHAIAYRDRFGRRPLWLGADKNGNYIAMSEDRAIEIIGGKPIREIKPGEMVTIWKNHIEQKQVVDPETRLCFFEANYLARRLSHLWEILKNQDVNVAQLRRELGLELFKEHPPLGGIDFVAHIPKSPLDAAQSYSEASGLSRVELFYKINSNRAFMGATQQERNGTAEDTIFVDTRLSPDYIGSSFTGIDDSVVRGTNVPIAKEKAKERGFNMRQLLVYTPVIGGREGDMDLGCENGVDMPPDDNFVARRVGRDPKRIADALGIEHVGFLSIEGLLNVFERYGIGRKQLCLECVRAKNF